MLPKMVKIQFFSPLVAKICNFGIKYFDFEILKHFLTENEKKQDMLPKRINKTQLLPFLCLFLFSQKILQNGLNGSKNCQNTTFFTPGGQNMKLWNESQFFEILKHFLTENEKTEAMLPKCIDKTRHLPFVCFFLFSQEILQNGRNVS